MLLLAKASIWPGILDIWLMSQPDCKEENQGNLQSTKKMIHHY
jgi:hypothetical protein